MQTKFIEWLIKTNKFTFEIKEKLNIPSYQFNYFYALKIIKGRWPEGEEEISKNAFYSLMYARDVIKGRFELGEKRIKDPTFGDHFYNYYLEIVKNEEILSVRTIIS